MPVNWPITPSTTSAIMGMVAALTHLLMSKAITYHRMDIFCKD
jgi:hypothetical protein